MKNLYYIVRIYFSKSYLKPHEEYHLDIINTEKNKIINRLKRKHYDTFREEILEK